MAALFGFHKHSKDRAGHTTISIGWHIFTQLGDHLSISTKFYRTKHRLSCIITYQIHTHSTSYNWITWLTVNSLQYCMYKYVFNVSLIGLIYRSSLLTGVCGVDTAYAYVQLDAFISYNWSPHKVINMLDKSPQQETGYIPSSYWWPLNGFPMIQH